MPIYIWTKFEKNMKVDWINEKDILENLIKTGVPYSHIGKKYSVTGAAVKKAAKKLGIELEYRRVINPTEHFNKGKNKNKTVVCLNCGREFKPIRSSLGKFCCVQCNKDFQYKEFIERWKNGEENGLKGVYGLSNHIRKYIFEKNECRCEKCGWGEKNEFTGTVPLEIHHIDGNYANNKEENLQLLCPNCHSLTETHKSHNKTGRVGRKKYSKN